VSVELQKMPLNTFWSEGLEMSMNTLASSFLYAFNPLISIVPSLPLMSSGSGMALLIFHILY
jgi:hypothetical protein